MPGMGSKQATVHANLVRKLIGEAADMAGSEAKLGEAIGYSQNGIWRARKKGVVTPELALKLHHYSGGKCSASKMRPDIWANDDAVPPAPISSPPTAPEAAADSPERAI